MTLRIICWVMKSVVSVLSNCSTRDGFYQRFFMRLTGLLILFLICSCKSDHRREMKHLDLTNKGLSRIPDSVFNFTCLETLMLGTGGFTVYPPLSALGESVQFAEDRNHIREIPGTIALLGNLRSLGLSFNDVQVLPEELVYLKKLDSLDLSFNGDLQISASCHILFQMKSLQYLNVFGTRVDSTTIDRLRWALPRAEIIATYKDVGVDIEKISKDVSEIVEYE